MNLMRMFCSLFSQPGIKPRRWQCYLSMVIACLSLSVSAAWAQLPADESALNQERETLDTQIQTLKKDVLDLNRDLFLLEEELLFPASTQVSVFVSLDIGTFFKLDSVQLKMNGKIVANYLYTDREIDALHRGAVQQLYISNLPQGKHELVAIFVGFGPQNLEYRRATTLNFDKALTPKFIELKIADSSQKQQPDFMVKEW